MAKKRQSQPSATGGEQGPVSLVPGEYEVGKWAGQPHFKCCLCHFDTLIGDQRMLEHLVNTHNSERALELWVGRETPGQPVEAHGDTQVVAIYEVSQEEVENLLNEGESDGKRNSS